MKISVVMPSYLGEYSVGPNNSATNREFKLKRAIDSFLLQIHKDSELIIVSDGCEATINIVESEYRSFLDESKIKLLKLEKQPLFSGRVRAEGLNHVTGDLVCYLDSDDMIGPYHLDVMEKYYDRNLQWMYYDDYLYDGDKKTLRIVAPVNCRIGTSSFCHLSSSNVRWQDGYGHDWQTISSILGYPHRKMQTPEYLVCHLSVINLDF
jgi:glycosyltransferase involved in cell wall biosynthesis